MALCSFSSKLAMDGFTVIENIFFNEFLPQATGEDVKVYLYGLNLCSNPNVEDNSISTICKVLSLTEEQVVRAFSYWQEMGLVQIVSKNPFEVRFLPVHTHSGSNKIRNTEKYAEFNASLQDIITGRMITPTEFNEYYTLIETFHFEPEAITLIAQYCVKLKSNSIGYPYILAVARSFASEGLKTYESIEQKLLEQEKSGEEIKQVLNALGIKRDADIDERNLYMKWIEKFGFSQGVITQIAKMQKKRGGFFKLDEVLTKFFELHLFTIEEIENYSEKQEEMLEIARQVSKIIGVYYQNYDSVISNYVTDWMNKGYDAETLYFVGNYCFKQSIRTLEGMNVVIQKFYKLGLISLQSIEQYIGEILKNDENIRQVLDSLGLLRSISSSDRELYKTWTINWNFSNENVITVAELCKDKTNQMVYMNKVLAGLREHEITSTDEIKNYVKNFSSGLGKTNKKPEIYTRELSKEQLSAVLDSLDEVEI